MSLPYGQKGTSLLQELKRSDWLPPYNADGVRQVVEEINALYAEAKKLSAESKEEDGQDPSVACPMLVYHHGAERNKRTLLAYLKFRMDKICELRWQTGSVVPDDLKPKLCESEIRLFDDYDSLLGNYMQALDLELTATMKPPKQLMIEVRVLKDCGEIVTDSGPVNLQKNTYHFLKRSDVEHLIQQNYVEEI